MNLTLALLVLCSSLSVAASEKWQRLLTIGGTNSEIVCALGLCSDIVATDSSSRYPAELGQLPQIGYARSIGVEGVLAQNPDLIILSEEAGPKSALAQLRSSSKKILELPSQPTLQSAQDRILKISQTLGRETQGRALLSQMDAALELLEKEKKGLSARPKVLFVYARGSRSLLIAGENTAADFMIGLAGGENAVKGFREFKTLTPEAVIAAAPDTILMASGGLQSLGGPESVWTLPGLKHTPAFATKKLIVMDDLFLLGMGPRLGTAALELLEKLQAEAGRGPQPLKASTVRN